MRVPRAAPAGVGEETAHRSRLTARQDFCLRAVSSGTHKRCRRLGAVLAIEPIAVICYHELMILGIDEVGRGPWAGPLVVGAVILGGAEIDGLDDSKKLTKKRRQTLDALIRQQAAAWALGWVGAEELEAAAENVRAEYPDVLLDDAETSLKALTALYREAAETGKTVAVVVS